MPALRYRTIKTPPGRGNITLAEAVESARIVAARRVARGLATSKPNGQANGKAVTASTSTHSPATSSGAVGKNRKGSSTSKSTQKIVASKR